MAGITQSIPHYIGGISEQPDQLKKPGQVKDAVNVVPDPVWGLYKRPGAKRLTTGGDNLGLTAVSTDAKASWFHYYRDQTEGSYIGQVDESGVVRIWNDTGAACTVNYGVAWVSGAAYGMGDLVTYSGSTYIAKKTHKGVSTTPNSDSTNWQTHSETYEVALKKYLEHDEDHNTKEDIQALTIMDTTFLNNRTQSVSMFTGSGDKAAQPPHAHFAFVDILKTENGRQYSMNVYNKEDIYTYRTATSIEFGGEGNANITGNTSTATVNDTLAETDGSGTCRGIGTQVFVITMPLDSQTFNNEPSTNEIRQHGHKMRNLAFRITTTGQNGIKTGYTAGQNGPSGTDYKCTYHRELTLLHGGEGWEYQDTTAPLKWKTADNSYNTFVQGTQVGDYDANNIGFNGQRIIALTDQPRGDNDGNPAQYRIRIKDDEPVKTKGFIHSNPVGIIRPLPTPWDTDTGVTADAICAGIIEQFDQNKFTGYGSDGDDTYSLVDNGINIKMIGTGLYIYSDTKQFNVEILDNDLMRVMQDEVNDVSKLPIQCKHGYIVKVSNSQKSDEDDYYLKFKGDNNLDGPGSWVECAAPGVLTTFNPSTMPIGIQRTAENTFTVKQWKWAEREVGDDLTNRIASFAGNPNSWDSEGKITGFDTSGDYGKINKVLFYRNRLALLSGENVILCQPGNFTKPNFWSQTALAVSAIDPIDIAAAGTLPSVLYDGIEANAGLIVFSRNQQYLLASDDTVMNPDTAKMRSVSTYFYNEKTPPISLGTTTGFLDDSGKYSRFQEMAEVQREGEALVRETSLVVPTLLPNGLDLITNSKENGMVFLAKSGTNTVYIYKYLQGDERRVQSAWFKWTFMNNIKYHFAMDDSYYFLDDKNFFQKINLVQSASDYVADAYMVQDGTDYLVHFDNYIQTGSADSSYNATTNETTYTFPWLDDTGYVHGTSPKLVGIVLDALSQSDADADVGGQTYKGYYVECKSASGTSAVFPGDVRPTGIGNKKLTVGFLYEYKVDLPRVYATKTLGDGNTRADVNGRLTLHRLNFNFGKVGVYDTTLTRLGKDTYTDNHESLTANQFNIGDLPWVDEDIKVIPVYEKNDNVDITLKSNHPSPCTLHSLSWEGDFSPKHYRRV